MRFVVYGIGAVGGVVAGRLLQHGHDVVGIARGAHLEAVAARGLTVLSAEEGVTVPLPVVSSPDELELGGDDVVLLGVKGQDTAAALRALAVAGPDVAVVCLQNGVCNEREALRRFADTYGIIVRLPATHLDPGVVVADSAPVSGILDISRYPRGRDDRAVAIADALRASSFSSEAVEDVMRWKYRKLITNLGNAVNAACGSTDGATELAARARAEGEAALAAAGIDVASVDEEAARRADLMTVRPVEGARRGGSSTWQSLARGTGAVEVDELNGEIVLLGRLHGTPTPVNAVLQQVATRLAASGGAPGSIPARDVLARLEGLPAS